MVYLLGVMLVAARFGRGPSVLTAVLAVAAFDFFFVPPQFTFAVSDTQYLITFAVMFLVGIVISNLTASLRTQAHVAGYREKRWRPVRHQPRTGGSARRSRILSASGCATSPRNS